MLQNLTSIPGIQKYIGGGVAVLALIYLAPPALRPYLILGAIAATLLVAFFNKGLKKLQRAKASAFDRGLTADANKPTKGKAETRKAVAEVAERWNKAIAELKAAGLSLYDLPWYLLIGEPQSGKSTTLRNSGLEFPVGTDALSGAGGTRNCDWWFTNEAIILDTAGRFTFQEKNAPDAEEWNGFLRLLRKNRPACPINGVVLTIPCTSLLNDDPETREEKARNIREKLTQIQRELGVQFPVFILITKSDQILGFTEFFSRLSATEQRQMVGWSMHGPFIQAYNPDTFNDIFFQLYERIHKWRLKLLGEDLSLTDVDKMYVFPEEFLALREPLYDYLKTIFVRTQFLPPLFFRGFYFTSGLQQGRPVAKACAAMIRTAGAGAEEIIEHLQKIFERSRAFFIRDFYLEKLFPERALVIHSEGRLQRDRRLAMAAAWGGAALLLLTLGFVGWRGWELRRGIGTIQTVAEKVYRSFTTERARLARAGVEPLDVETLADQIKLAADFDRDAQDTIQRLPGLAADLRDMFWIHFVHNVLRDRGEALYAQLRAAPAGGSLSDAAVGEQMARYARLWGLNLDWLDHTRGGRGGFERAAELADAKLWSALLPDGVASATREAFAALLGRLREVLDAELDFGERPVEVALVPGDTRPARNELFRREIEALAASFRPADSATVQSIVAAANDVRARYAQAIGAALNVPCGYPDPETDPFAPARQAAVAIREAIASLDSTLETNRDLLRSLASDPVSVRDAFEQVAWAKNVEGTAARRTLGDYLRQQADDVAERLRGDAERARLPLRDVSDVILTSGTLMRSPALDVAGDGLNRLLQLADAQNAAVRRLAGAAVRTADQARQEADAWLQTPARQEALTWANAYAARADLPPAWQIMQLAQALQRMVRDGDESVRVQAWLAYARGAMPDAPLTRNQIAEATLAADPPPGARPDQLARALERLKSLGDELTAFRADVTCERNLERLRRLNEDLQAAQRAHQANFVAYWRTAFDRWDPAAWLQPIDSWEALKSAPLLQGANLSLRIKQELLRFVTNVQGYRERTGSAGELAGLLNDLTQFVAPGSVIEQNANQFCETIASLDANKLVAATQLEQSSGGQSRLRALEAIATRSSSLNPKFEYYPRKVRALLDASREFEIELGRFLARWARDLSGKFPFAVDPSAVRIEGQRVVIPQATARQVREFFVGADSLPAFVERYRALYDQWAAAPDRAAAAAFVQDCLRMRDFYFQGTGGEFRPVRFEATYTGFDGQSEQDLRLISERLDLIVPRAAAEPTQVRWRSQVPGSTQTFEWTPGDYGTQGLLRFRSSLERGDNPNTAQIEVEGDFALLAYIVTQSAPPEAEGRRWQTKFGVSPAGSTQRYLVNFVFVLDRGLPRLPDWSAVRRWAQ